MNDFTIIRAADHKVMRWKNGGGETAEIAVSPPDAALDAFDWRLSMAKVETDGPFSTFPGMDRTLAILEGEGIRLSVAGEPEVTLTKTAAPHTFAADTETSATLVGGPILDLNIMTRRGRAAHSVTRLHVDAPSEFAISGEATLLFCAEGKVKLGIGAASEEMARHDTIVWRGEPRTLLATGGGLIYVISLHMPGVATFR